MAVGDESEKQLDLGERALNLVREKLGKDSLACQLCGRNNWQIQDKPAFVFVVDRDLQHGSLLHGGSQDGLPFVVMACNTCGNTLFINSFILELHDPANVAEGNRSEHN